MLKNGSPTARDGYHGNARTDVLHLCDADPGRILDIGGGLGATAALIKEKLGGKFVALIDGAEVVPHEAVDLFLPGNIEDRQVWDSLDEHHYQFDTILCLDVLEHLVDPWSVVRACSKRLNNGGALIISIPNARNYKLTFPLFFLGKFQLRESGILDRTHLRWFVKDTAKELATCGGLKLEHFSGGWYMDRCRQWERLANVGVAPGFLFQNYYIRVRRCG